MIDNGRGHLATSRPVRAYSDRIRAPSETVALMRPYFAELGITRIARQTGLDVLGIPCFAAIRPNSRSIASNQGKGINDDFAMASAVMEAVEFAIAENPSVDSRVASFAELSEEGARWFDPRLSLPLGERLPSGPLTWVVGERLSDRRATLVPFDLVAQRGEAQDLPGICQSTNGLASGNTVDEAVFHAVCELVERDAGTLWSLLDPTVKRARCVSLDSFGDDLVYDFVRRFVDAGLVVRLFDQTSDLGVPTILAVSGPTEERYAKYFEVAAGTGTHPDPARAALRAITEAAQTRVTSIAGARDDHHPDTYRLSGTAEAFELLKAEPHPAQFDRTFAGNDPSVLLQDMLAKLRIRDVDDLVAVNLGGAQMGISVVKVVSGQLEDRGPNRNWRPGGRSLAFVLEAA